MPTPNESRLYAAAKIEALTRLVAEQNEEIERLNASPTIEACRQMIRDKAVIEASELHNQLTAAQAHNKLLRDALERVFLKVVKGFVTTEWAFVSKALAIESPNDALKEHDAALVERIAQAVQPEDSYQDEWFKAKADCHKRVMDIADNIRKESGND